MQSLFVLRRQDLIEVWKMAKAPKIVYVGREY